MCGKKPPPRPRRLAAVVTPLKTSQRFPHPRILKTRSMSNQNKLLRRLLFAQGSLCYFCRAPLPATEASVEHLLARVNGGSDRDDNCVACCQAVNALLGSMSLKEKIQVVLNQKGQFECPNGTQKKTKKTRPEASPRVAKIGAERYAQVIAHLKQRGKAKPRTVQKLKNVIVALFQKNLSENEVDALVRQLESHRVISIVQTKLTYLPGPQPRTD